MMRFLTNLSIENKRDGENLCIISTPPIDRKVLVKIRDQRAIIQHQTYFFLDEISGKVGRIYVWNSFRECIEKIKVSILDEGNKYLLELPENIIVDIACC